MAVLTLPHYPSTKTRAGLSPSQQATLNSKVSGALSQLLSLPADKRDIPSAVAFISSSFTEKFFPGLQVFFSSGYMMSPQFRTF